MSPLCQYQFDRLVSTFDGRVYVIKDYGDRVIFLVDPGRRGPFTQDEPDTGSDWARVTSPTVMFIDPEQSHYPRVAHCHMKFD